MNLSRELEHVGDTTEELMDWRGCDAVQFDPEKLGGAATVGNSRIDADTILLNYDDGMTVEELHDHFGGDVNLIRKVVEFIESRRMKASA